MSSPDWALTRFYHTVVNCRDLDVSLAFYRQLGFQVLNDRRNVEWPPFVANIFGLRRAQGRGVLMVLPEDPDGPMLDLIHWLEPQAQFPDPSRVLETVPRIIAFRTRNVQAAYESLTGAGVQFTQPPYTPAEDLGIIGTACCYDPDGNIVELIELKAGVRHSRATETLKERAGD